MGKGGLGNNCIDFSSFPDTYSGTKLSSTLHLYFSKLYKLYNLHFEKEFLFKKQSNTKHFPLPAPVLTCNTSTMGLKRMNCLICIIVSPLKKPRSTSCNYYKFKEYSHDTH